MVQPTSVPVAQDALEQKWNVSLAGGLEEGSIIPYRVLVQEIGARILLTIHIIRRFIQEILASCVWQKPLRK